MNLFMTARGQVGAAVFVSAVFVASAGFCAADDEAAATNQISRPIEELFKNDTVYVQEKGEWQAGLSPTWQNNPAGNTWTVPIVLEYGLTDQWQVEAEWNALVQHRSENGSVASGIGDLELGTQYSFMNVGGSLFHVAPLFSIELPLANVNQGLTEGFLEYQPAVVLARDFPRLHHTQVFAEIGLTFVQRVKRPSDSDDVEPAAHSFNLGTGFFTPFAHGALTMEFNWANNQWNHHGTQNDLYLTPGVIWKPVRGVELGVGLPVGLNNSSDRYDVVFHVIYEF
jgi:hypothetical protein